MSHESNCPKVQQLSTKFYKPKVHKVTEILSTSSSPSYSHSSYPVERCHCLFPTPQKVQSISIFCDLQTSHGWHTGRRWRVVALHGFQRWIENPALVKHLAQAIFSSTMQQSSPFPFHRFELVCWGFMTQARRKSADPPKAGFWVFPSYPSWAAQILFPCNTAVRFQRCSSCFIHGDIRWGDLYNDKLWGSEAYCWVVNTEWEWVRLWSACTWHQLKTQQILKDTPLYETLQYSAFSVEWCRSYMWGHFCKPKWKKKLMFLRTNAELCHHIHKIRIAVWYVHCILGSTTQEMPRNGQTSNRYTDSVSWLSSSFTHRVFTPDCPCSQPPFSSEPVSSFQTETWEQFWGARFTPSWYCGWDVTMHAFPAGLTAQHKPIYASCHLPRHKTHPRITCILAELKHNGTLFCVYW